MDVNEKIERFSAVIFKEAENEQKQILSDINRSLETDVEIIKQRVAEKAKEKIDEELAKSVRERNKNVLNVSVEAKKELLKLRDEIHTELFSEVLSKLRMFVGAPQYEQWLVERALECKNELNGDIAVVIVTQNDMKFAQRIEAETGYKVQAGDSGILGGCRALCEQRKIMVDKTIGSRFDEQKELFNRIKINM